MDRRPIHFCSGSKKGNIRESRYWFIEQSNDRCWLFVSFVHVLNGSRWLQEAGVSPVA